MNVDFGWPDGVAGNPNPGELLRLGIQRVRFIGRGPEVQSRINQYRDAGIFTLAMFNEESNGWIVDADAIQAGTNEPNFNGVSPNAFAADLQGRIARRPNPETPWVAGALANWGTLAERINYITAVRQAGGLTGYSGIAVNYPPSSTQVIALAKAAALPCWVTEYHVDLPLLLDYLRGLRSVTPAAFGFCWDEAMVAGYGFSDAMRRTLAAAGSA